MKNTVVYSIGHGNKAINNFIDELRCFEIQYLVDIRSTPFSKWNPDFNQKNLKKTLHKNNITYVFMGDALGGLPKDRSCYQEDGRVNYSILREKEFFKKGIERLVTASKKQLKIVIMCSESKPEECHRSKLIGQELIKLSVAMEHILPEGEIISQADVIKKLTGGYGAVNLFGEVDLMSRGKY